MVVGENKATIFFSDGSGSVELPILAGTAGPDVIDIRSLYKATGKFTYDPGFLSTASCQSGGGERSHLWWTTKVTVARRLSARRGYPVLGADLVSVWRFPSERGSRVASATRVPRLRSGLEETRGRRPGGSPHLPRTRPFA